MLLAFPRFCFSAKLTSLDIFDMYFVKFDVFGQYLNNIWSMFVQQVSVQVYMSPTIINSPSATPPTRPRAAPPARGGAGWVGLLIIEQNQVKH